MHYSKNYQYSGYQNPAQNSFNQSGQKTYNNNALHIWQIKDKQTQGHGNQDSSNQGQQSISQKAYSFSQLQRNLLIFQRKHALRRIINLIKQKMYWIKFSSFKKFFSHIQPYQFRKIRNNKLKIVLYTHLIKNNSINQLKLAGLRKFKQTKNQNEQIKILITNFFIKYFINSSYVKLSFGFNAIKQFQHSNCDVLVRQIRQKQVNHQNQEKLKKFYKQSVKFRAKTVFVILRNFISKKCLKSAFSALKSYQPFQNIGLLQNQRKNLGMTFGIKQINGQPKDARFIKKKVLPHRIIQGNNLTKTNLPSVQTLANINFGNFQVQSIKKNQFFSISIINGVFCKKRNQAFYNFFSFLLQHHNKSNSTEVNSQKRHKQTQNLIKNSDQDQDFDIVKNVAKNICYLSSQANKKNFKSQVAYNKRLSIRNLNSILGKTINKVQSLGFYGIKMFSYYQNKRVIQKINQLQQIKKYYLECFDNDDDQGTFQ